MICPLLSTHKNVYSELRIIAQLACIFRKKNPSTFREIVMQIYPQPQLDCETRAEISWLRFKLTIKIRAQQFLMRQIYILRASFQVNHIHNIQASGVNSFHVDMWLHSLSVSPLLAPFSISQYIPCGECLHVFRTLKAKLFRNKNRSKWKSCSLVKRTNGETENQPCTMQSIQHYTYVVGI